MAMDIQDAIRFHSEDLFTLVGSNTEKIDEISTAPYSYWKETFKQLLKKPSVYICISVLLIIVLLAVFGPYIHSFNVDVSGLDAVRFGQNADGSFTPIGPNSVNWFGCVTERMDNVWQGLDLWTLVWQGSRLSLLLGVTVAFIETFIGILVGALWGYFSWLDPIMIEIRNFVNNIPSLLLNILFMQLFLPYMQDYAFFIIVFLLTFFSWMGLASLIRNQIIIIRNREYNVASQTLGSGAGSMITHNFLPYIISVIVSSVSLSIPGAISAEVGLAFFGLSFRMTDGDVTLGQLLTAVTEKTTASGGKLAADWVQYPWLLIAPLIVLAPLTICFYYLGIALADASDPRRHR